MLRHYPLNPATGLEDASQLPWINGNPSTDSEGSYPPFGLFTDPHDSILAAQNLAGLTAANDVTQLGQAIAKGIYLGAAAGTANALTATLPGGVVFPALTAGMRFSLVGAATNTAAVTLAITGFTASAGVVPVVNIDGSPLVASEITAGRALSLTYDGTSFVLVNPSKFFLSYADKLSPKGATKNSIYTQYALTDISGISTDNVAQTLTVTSATYIDAFLATSINFAAVGGTAAGATCIVGMRAVLFQGGAQVRAADLSIGCIIQPSFSIPLVCRQVWQGLDPTLTYVIKMICQKGTALDNIQVNDAYIVSFSG